MKELLLTVALGLSSVAHAGILAMSYDKDNKAVVALSDIPCSGVRGMVAGVRTEDKKDFIGCWYGDGESIHIYFPELDKTITYQARVFSTVNQQLERTEGGIRSTI